jgi:hypothetical protein
MLLLLLTGAPQQYEDYRHVAGVAEVVNANVTVDSVIKQAIDVGVPGGGAAARTRRRQGNRI